MLQQSKKVPSLVTVFNTLHDIAKDAGEVDQLDKAAESKSLSRDTFFEAAYWAILAANRDYDKAQTWVENADTTGFPFNWLALSDWGDDQFDAWSRRMAKTLVSRRKDLVGKFRERWWSIWDLGWWLAEFEEDGDFRIQVFDGKTQGTELDDSNVARLRTIKRRTGRLWWIGEANRYFVLRNLGGDFLKPDVWVREFCHWYGCVSVGELAKALRLLGIHCGKFDAYLWGYCQREIQQVSGLGDHFDQMFMGS